MNATKGNKRIEALSNWKWEEQTLNIAINIPGTMTTL